MNLNGLSSRIEGAGSLTNVNNLIHGSGTIASNAIALVKFAKRLEPGRILGTGRRAMRLDRSRWAMRPEGGPLVVTVLVTVLLSRADFRWLAVAGASVRPWLKASQMTHFVSL